MPDREKVIKGLECCHNKNMLWQHDQCPYHGFDEDCESNLHADALALLKEQQQQIWELQDQVEYFTDKLKEQENESKRNPVIVCPHCGKRVK